ncbi:MAG: PQQ-binding-like beta-propeller repeat protein [Planctomycetota bacterium]|nr:PQQ-binding-like beta-propeller repeat protein [Planctomycetota bacterium]
MSLKGNLSSVNLTEIFQMLSLSGREGTLFIYEGARKRAICFTKEGVSIHSHERSENNLLGRIMVRLGRVTSEELAKGIEKRRGSSRPLGDILVDLGYCTPDDIMDALKVQGSEDIQELFLNPSDAQFEYVDGYFPEEENAAQAALLNVNALLIDIARRSDEWEYIRARVRSVRQVYRFTGVEGQVDGGALDECYAQRVDPHVDGTNSVQDLIDKSYVNRFEVCKLLSTYLDAGIIELVPQEAMLQAARHALRNGDAVRAVRHYEYLMSAGGCPLDVFLEASEAYEAARDHAQATGLLRRYAEELVREGQTREALDALRRITTYPRPDLDSLRFLLDLAFQHPRVADEFSPQVIEAGKTLVASYTKNGQRPEALALLERLVRAFPEEIAFAISLVNVHYEEGNVSKASQECERLANGFLKRKKPGQAVSLYKKLLIIDPERHDIRDRVRKLVSGRRKTHGSSALPRVAAVVGLLLVLGAAAFVYLQPPAEGEGELPRAEITRLKAEAVAEQAVAEQHARTAVSVFERLERHLADDALKMGDNLRKDMAIAGERYKQYRGRADKARDFCGAIHRGTSDEQCRAQVAAMLTALDDLDDDITRARHRWQRKAHRTAALLYKRGIDDYTAGILKRALQRLRLGRVLNPDVDTYEDVNIPRTIRNLEEDIEKFLEAQRLGKHLEGESDFIGARRIYIELMEDYEGTDLLNDIRLPFEVYTVPSGATVTVDGERVPQTTPCHVRLRPNSKSIVRCSKKGFVPHKETLGPFTPDLEAGDMTLQYNLLKKAAWELHVGGFVESSPAAWKDRVAVAGRNGRWFLLSAKSGKIIAEDEIHALGGISAGLVSDGKNFYVAVLDGELHAYGGRKGERLYRIRGFPGKLRATPAMADHMLYIADYDGNVYAYPAGGKRYIWKQTTPPGVRVQPLVHGEHLIVVSGSGEVSVLKLKDGAILNQYKLKGTFTLPPVAAGADLLFANTDGRLFSVEKLTGKLRWQSQVARAIPTLPVVRGGAAFLSPKAGQLLVIDTSTGDEIYRFTEGGGRTAQPTAGRVLIYFAHGSDLTAYARTAEGYGLAWTFRAKARILVGPVQTEDAVYVGDEKGHVYRIDLAD